MQITIAAAVCSLSRGGSSGFCFVPNFRNTRRSRHAGCSADKINVGLIRHLLSVAAHQSDHLTTSSPVVPCLFQVRMSQTSGYSAVHHDPDGPGDARPTALDIVADETQEGRLANQVMLITGCSPGGLGVEVARALHLTGKMLSVALTLLRTLRKLMPYCSEFAHAPWITVACSS